jgi:hypothetical protein
MLELDQIQKILVTFSLQDSAVMLVSYDLKGA